jgi:sugar phosphate permease
MAAFMATQVPRTASAAERPTRVRYGVIVFAVTLAVITYIDRVCISQAAPAIRHDLGFSEVEMGYIFAAFAWAYALFEIPSGFLGDWMGPRRVLMRIVVWWSFFTAATGWAFSFVSMAVTRFLFGAGVAGCFPNLTKAFTIWLPRDERVRAQGIMWLSARWGGAFTPLLVVGVFKLLSWRHAFEAFGAIGLVWAVAFYWWFRDHPRDKAGLNDAERELLRPNEAVAIGHARVPWKVLARSRQVWLLCLQYAFLSYGWYFYITWLPSYLAQARHMAITAGALAAGLPLFLGGLGSLVCGFVSAPVERWMGSVARARRLMACIGFTGASGLLLLSTRFEDPLYAILAMGFASFSNDLVMPGSWGACMDVGGRYAGTLSGAMNMAGNIGGALSPMMIGYMLKWTHSNWDVTFYVSAAVYFMGTFCWLTLDPVTPLETESA